jgi:hypothetical protein
MEAWVAFVSGILLGIVGLAGLLRLRGDRPSFGDDYYSRKGPDFEKMQRKYDKEMKRYRAEEE